MSSLQTQLQKFCFLLLTYSVFKSFRSREAPIFLKAVIASGLRSGEQRGGTLPNSHLCLLALPSTPVQERQFGQVLNYMFDGSIYFLRENVFQNSPVIMTIYIFFKIL